MLKDFITAASICLTPSVAWATFVSNRNSRLDDRMSALRRVLLEVKKELDYISHWAQTEYPESATNDIWRNPFWSVNDFPSDHIHEFNQSVDPGRVPPELRAALDALETSIARFRKLLVAHQEFLYRGGGRDLAAQSSPSPTEVVAFSPFPSSPAWLDRLYELNRDIHVTGIGTIDDSGGLHATWKRAVHEVNRFIMTDHKSRHSPTLWVGHVLAATLGAIGFGYLVSFLYVLFKSFSLPSVR